MSKVARGIAVVAGVAALTIATAGAFAPAGATILGTSFATAAAVASAVATVSTAAATALQKPPPMQGTVNQVMIAANAAVPYAIGRSYLGGNLIYDNSDDGPDNDERTQIFAYTVAGPIDAFQKLMADYSQVTIPISGGRLDGAASGFYANFLWCNSRLGLRPDTALTTVTGMTGGMPPGWTSNHKLSGIACAFVCMEFDEKGVRYASGVPQWGVVAKWVKVYDPRLDSTYPGGSGSQTWADEGTWTWSENPALHALAYARGRFVNDVKVCGVGIPKDQINLARFVEWANLCDANGWTIGGAVYEGPGLSKWDNLKRIAQAGGGRVLWARGWLDVILNAPKTSLDTVTKDDLTSGVQLRAMKTWRERVNTIVPRYRSEDHKWEYVQSDEVSSATYVTEDGEKKTREVQYDLVQDKDQAAQLAGYELVNGREFGPITFTAKPRLMAYKPGEALTLNIPEAALFNEVAVIISRSKNPATGEVTLTLESETSAKHAFALGLSGTAPPTPTIVDSATLDQAVVNFDPSKHEMPDIAPVVIQADYAGAVNAGQLPRNVLAKRFVGGVDVTATSAWTMSASAGITATIGAATGVVEITTPMTANSGTITVTSNYSGIALSRTFPVTKQLGSTPIGGGGGGGSSASDSSFAPITSNTLMDVSDVLTVIAGSAGKVNLTAPLDISIGVIDPHFFGSTTYDTYGRWYRVTAPAGDLGAAESLADPLVASHGDEEGNGTVTSGAISVSHEVTGLTPGNSYQFKLRARKGASGNPTMYLSGTASAVGS